MLRPVAHDAEGGGHAPRDPEISLKRSSPSTQRCSFGAGGGCGVVGPHGSRGDPIAAVGAMAEEAVRTSESVVRAAVARLVREDEDIRAAIVNSSITIKALRFKAATALGKPAEVGARARRRAISAALTVRVRRAFAGLEGV